MTMETNKQENRPNPIKDSKFAKISKANAKIKMETNKIARATTV
jgi:hypothetical protein